jgi:hypothetical protein
MEGQLLGMAFPLLGAGGWMPPTAAPRTGGSKAVVEQDSGLTRGLRAFRAERGPWIPDGDRQIPLPGETIADSRARNPSSRSPEPFLELSADVG